MNVKERAKGSDRVSRLGFKPQKEVVYVKALPNAAELDEEAVRMFSEIKAKLGKSVMMRELRPGCAMWTARLIKYIRFYGLKMPKEDHIHLIHLMYELVTLPNLEPYLVNEFSRVLILLLKKRELISYSELTLPWRPLFDMCVRILSSNAGSLGMYRYFSSLEVTLDSLVHSARYYFPPSATQEMLEEWRPLLCPFDSETIGSAVENMEWFFPISLPPTLSDRGYKLWFEDMMNLWNVCNNAPSWDNEMMWLMARLARCNIGYIDWEPYIPIMFSRFMRSLQLPVSFKQLSSPRNHKLDVCSIAIWIVSVLGGGSSAQKYFEKFMMAVESYFHPANFGRWILKLSELLSQLPLYFVHRLNFERYKTLTWETPVPESHKLTEEDITKFVEAIRPVAMKAMFSKMGLEVTQTMQHLATLRPKLVIPEIIESVYANLETVVQPHRFQAALHCLVAVTRPMVEGGKHDYREGPTHVIPLLFGVLPGIDPNDIRKCFGVLHFISTVSTMVPLVDCSKASEYHHDLTEEEETICLATASFEDFVLQFLDRCFSLIESTSLESTRMERDADRPSRTENMAENALASTCVVILSQTSRPIFKAALKKLQSFVMSRILETKVAGQCVATICRAFAKVDPDETLRLFIPHLCDNILTLTNSDDVLKEEIVDHELLYNLVLVSELVECSGKSLVQHLPILRKVMDRTLHMSSREGSGVANKLLNNILKSLSTTIVIEYRNVPQAYVADIKDYLPVRDWGKPGNIHDLDLKWYVPGEEEEACAQSIVSTYLPEEVKRIEKFIEDESTITRDELQCSLGIILSIFGCATFFPVWDEEPLQLFPSRLPESPFISVKPHDKYNVTMPDGSNVRKAVAMLMDRLQAKLLQCKEDDTRSFSVLVNIWESLLTRHDDNSVSDNRWKKFRLVKKILENKLVGGKLHLRVLLIDRVILQLESVPDRTTACLTDTHKMVMMNLLTLSTSKYSEVRIRAQNKLLVAVKNFPYSFVVLVEKLVEYLKKDTVQDHDQFKGALYVLLGPKQYPIITRHNWWALQKLWPAIVEAKPSEKISVIRLLDNVVDVVHKHFPTLTIKIQISDKCVEAARKLWGNAPLPSEAPATDEEVAEGIREMESRNQNNLEEYMSLLHSLNHSAENGKLHWRFHAMALCFLRDLVHPDVPYPPAVVRCFVNTLIHDSLELRKLAIRCVIFVLKHQKLIRKRIEVNPYSLFNIEKPEKVYPGDRPDNQWVQYKSPYIPQNSEDWNKPLYVHATYHGYYDWPKKLKLHAPPLEPPPLMNQGNLTEGEKEVLSFFTSSSNVSKLMDFFSLEEKKGKDKFSGFKFLFFKSLFRNGGYDMFEIFFPHLNQLVRSKQESHQRCAAEILSGAVRGSKHWPFEMVQALWEKLTPLVRCALSNMTEETINDWGTCFATAAEHRDPRRLRWLYDVLMEEPPANETSFIECGRLYSIQGALNQQSWRMSDVLSKWLERLKPYLSHPFQNVRERMGSVMNSIFDSDVIFPGGNPPRSPRVSNFIDFLMPHLSVLHDVSREAMKHIPTYLPDKNNISVAVVGQVEMQNGVCPPKNAKESAIRLLKTVCRWIASSVARSQFGVSPHIYQLLPVICLMESYEADEELGRTCTAVLVAMGQAFHDPESVSAGLAAIQKVSQSSSWQSRFTCLEYLLVFVFNNMSIILSSEEWTKEVTDIVLRLVEDDWLDVRVKSAEVLGGLLHIGFIENSLALLDVFRRRAATKLTKTNNRVDPVPLKFRHSGVLGLCAFINAFPYDVPEFIPELFVVLGQHLNDPQPIPSTIRKTLGDFKRTHHDNWAKHSLKFTEAQLTVLGDLTIPPSYYA